MKRKLLISLFIVILTISFTTPAFAGSGEKKVAKQKVAAFLKACKKGSDSAYSYIGEWERFDGDTFDGCWGGTPYYYKTIKNLKKKKFDYKIVKVKKANKGYYVTAKITRMNARKAFETAWKTVKSEFPYRGDIYEENISKTFDKGLKKGLKKNKPKKVTRTYRFHIEKTEEGWVFDDTKVIVYKNGKKETTRTVDDIINCNCLQAARNVYGQDTWT